MPWRVFIVAVRDNPTPTDSVYVDVEFRDIPQGQSVPVSVIAKDYKFSAGTTREDFKAFLLEERAKYRRFANARDALKDDIGQEVS